MKPSLTYWCSEMELVAPWCSNTLRSCCRARITALPNEIVCNWTRLFECIDLTSRSLVSLIEPASCFVASLLEIALASDRCYIPAGHFADNAKPDPPEDARVMAMSSSFIVHPMANGLSRPGAQFLQAADTVEAIGSKPQQALNADTALKRGR